MTVSHWQTDPEPPLYETDFLIVGAGLTGCSAAIFATAAGHQVTLTDARGLGLGASSRNAGFLLSGIDAYYHRACERYGEATVRELWALSLRTHEHWRRWAEGRTAITPSGTLLLAQTAAEARDIERAARALAAAGIEHIHHPRDPLERGYHAALERRQDAAVHPLALLQAVFEQSDATLLENNAVHQMEATTGDTALVHSRRYRIRARHVLLCVNGYAPLLHPYFRGKIVPVRAQCTVTEPLEQSLLKTCGYADYGYWYFRETDDGRFLLGGGRAAHRDQENDTSEDRTTPAVQAEIDTYRQRHFPEIRVPVARRWAGIMGFSADGLPLVGRLPGLPQVGFALGFNGNGLALSAGVAERAVELLLEGRHPGALATERLG